MRRSSRFAEATVILAFGLLILLSCSHPTEQMLRWQQKIEIPVSNEPFVLANQLRDLFGGFKGLKDFTILGQGDTNVAGVYAPDTHVVAFSKATRDSFSFRQTQDSMENKTFQDNIGTIPLSGVGTVSQTAILPTMGSIGAATPFTVTDTIRFGKIHGVTFNSTCPPLVITIANTANVTISNLVVTLVGQSLSSAAAGIGPSPATAAATIGVAGASIDSTLQVRVSGTLQAGGSIAAGKGLALSFSFDGLTASAVTVIDSLVSFSRTFTNLYKLTDTVDIQYADVKDGFFNYTLDNRSGLDLRPSVIHHNLWQTNECIVRNVRDSGSLRVFRAPISANPHLDTLNFYGGNKIVGESGTEVRAHQKAILGWINLSRMRLFPEWSDSLDNSVSRVDYVVQTPPPQGRWVTLHSTDSLIFTISPTVVTFSEMYGKMKKDFRRTSDTQWVDFPWPWSEAAKDSLRNKFILSLVINDTRVTMDLPVYPDSAFMDSLNVDFQLIDPKHPTDICDDTVGFSQIKDSSYYRRYLNITKVVNYLPDSLAVVTHTLVPAGTQVLVINDGKVDAVHNMGGMTVTGHVDYHLNAYLDWRVDSNCTMPLGSGKFEIPEKGARLIRQMDNRLVTFNAKIANHTNVYIRLFALMARGVKRNLIDSLTENQFSNLVSVQGRAEDSGYVNLFGPQGVLIPKRDSTTVNTVVLNDRQLDLILYRPDNIDMTDSAAWRWQLKFYQMPRDSLTNKDDIYVKSWLHAEGVANMDSLCSNIPAK